MVSNSPECYFWPCLPLELGWYVQSVSRRKLEFGKIVGKRSFFLKKLLKKFCFASFPLSLPSQGLGDHSHTQSFQDTTAVNSFLSSP